MANAIGPEATQGLNLASSVSKAFGGPGLPNVGAGLVNGLLGPSGKNNPTTSGALSGNTFGGSVSADSAIEPPAVPTAPTPVAPTISAVPKFNLFGDITSAGWSNAITNFYQAKGKL